MDYLLADVWARYQTANGADVRMSAGLDEHGTKVEFKARQAGVSPQQFVDKLLPSFTNMMDKMNISRTDLVRTSDPEHMRRVQEIWQRLDAAGVIYKSSYEGWYCSGCESFITETEAKAMDYICPDHKLPLEKLFEENYYLRVSDYTDQIHEFVKTAVVPKFRGREILELIRDGAQDVSISRPKEN
jgi:methionyl-tRNA synthetase